MITPIASVFPDSAARATPPCSAYGSGVEPGENSPWSVNVPGLRHEGSGIVGQ